MHWRLARSLALLVVCVASAPAAVITVGDGGQFSTIQPAIDAAGAGDTVLVTSGEYVITEPLTFRGKAITVRGESGHEATVIRMSENPTDATRKSVVIFESGETAASVLEGFTVTGGTGYVNNGGGIYCLGASPTLASCRITKNAGLFNGGGVYCVASSARLTDCIIDGNLAWNSGGAIYCAGAELTLTNTTVARNVAGHMGGGLYCQESSLTLSSCIVWGNAGEAMVCDEPSSLVVSHCCIESEDPWPGTGNINADPLFCGWIEGEVWVDGDRPGPGEGTQADPYASLSSALSGYRPGLKPASPCRGAGEDGADMGTPCGTCPAGGSETRLVHLAGGTYAIQAVDLFVGVSIDGSAAEETALEGTVFGLRTGSVLSRVTVTGGSQGGVTASPREAPEIRDCTIAGNSVGGVNCWSSSPTLENCTIKGNEAILGGGVICIGGSATLTSCTIVENRSGIGAGVYCLNASPALTDCTVVRNEADECGGGVGCEEDSFPSFLNCTVAGNVGRFSGGGVCSRMNAGPTFTNCTIAGNAADAGGGVACVTAGWAALTNCIVWENAGGSLEKDETSTIVASHCCIEREDPWPGTGNINPDPQFCGWPTADVWVAADRPGPGAGTEVDPFTCLHPALAAYPLNLAAGSPCLGSGEDGADMGASSETCTTAGSQSRVVHLGPGTYAIDHLSLTFDASILGAGEDSTVIEGSVRGLRTGSVLWDVTVRAGTISGVRISAGDAPEIRNCTIRDNQPNGGVYCTNASPTLVNCTIHRNEGIKGAGVYCDRDSSPILLGCAITENVTLRMCAVGGSCLPGDGGGLYCSNSSPVLAGCRISRNRATVNGGGIACDEGSFPAMTNCVITGNVAEQNGGGIACDQNSPAAITNCTITGNLVEHGGGGGLYCGANSWVTVVNTIIWNNTGGSILSDFGRAQPTYSCIESDTIWTGEGNSNLDPVFVAPGHWHVDNPDAPGDVWVDGDYRLDAASPCIDAGTRDGAPATDVQGHRRPCGEGIDMGAYESGNCTGAPFKRGETNQDGTLNVGDAVYALLYIFLNGDDPACLDAADVNDDGRINVADAVYILQYLFLNGTQPPAPFTECGVDPSPDELDCAAFPACR